VLQLLRSLSLQGVGLDANILDSMTQVTELQLKDVLFDVTALGRMSQLQHLVLDECRLLPGETVDPNAPSMPSQAAEAVLSAITQLTQLQVLKVVAWRREDVQASSEDCALPLQTDCFVLRDAPPAAFAALTTSSRLQLLHLDDAEHSLVPRGAATRMFPAGRSLKHLTALLLSPQRLQFHPRSHVLTTADLQSIASSCPSLQSLHIAGLLEPGTDPSPLLQLAECRDLSVGGRAFDNPAAGVVAQMTQLTSLTWWCSQGFDSVGLSQLTALTNLQKLVLEPVCQDLWCPLDEAEVVGSDMCGLLGVEVGVYHVGGSRRKELNCRGAMVRGAVLLVFLLLQPCGF
jgi:hypothetical protein